MNREDSAAFADFTVTLRNEGLRPALAGLLKRSDYRYIGIWRFEDGKANAVVHYDRENPEQTTADEVPDTATYCIYVRESGKPFKTPNAMVDERVAAHPARSTILSYCGVPVMDSDGTILGTLCHYDVVPRDPNPISLELMLTLGSYLALGKHVPPYPSKSAQA